MNLPQRVVVQRQQRRLVPQDDALDQLREATGAFKCRRRRDRGRVTCAHGQALH